MGKQVNVSSVTVTFGTIPGTHVRDQGRQQQTPGTGSTAVRVHHAGQVGANAVNQVTFTGHSTRLRPVRPDLVHQARRRSPASPGTSRRMSSTSSCEDRPDAPPGERAARCRAAPAAREWRQRCVRPAVHPPQGPAVGGRGAHARGPRGSGRRPPGRDDLGVPAGQRVPRRLGGDHLAAPHRRQRLPRPAPAAGGQARRQRAGRTRPWTSLAARAARARRGGRQRDRRSMSWPRCGPCRPTSGPRWCWWTCSATRWRTPRRCWASRPGTVKSRCARGRARLLPRLAHLRGRRRRAAAGAAPVPSAPQDGTQLGNQPPSGRVSPAEGGGEPGCERACRRSDDLAAFREELLSARKAAQVSAHLAACPRCAALEAQLAEVTACSPVPPRRRCRTHSPRGSRPRWPPRPRHVPWTRRALPRRPRRGRCHVGHGRARRHAGQQRPPPRGAAGRRTGWRGHDRSWLALRVAAVTAAGGRDRGRRLRRGAVADPAAPP